MALIVEDGTGLVNADSLIDIDYADEYHDERGNDGWGASTTELKEEALRRASVVLSVSFRWQGWKVGGRQQFLAFPRYHVIDEEGFHVDSNTVPTEIEKATAELALRELVSPNSLLPDIIPANMVKSRKVGPIAIEYIGSSNPGAVRPVVHLVGAIVSGLTNRSSSNPLAGSAIRV